MNNTEFLEYMSTHEYISKDEPILEKFFELSETARKITMELNNNYHTQDEIVKLFSTLTDKKVDESFRMFPPFYTECGVNITVGKNVFINAACKFQDQGGIEIRDGVFIGHSVIIATLNHVFNPSNRTSMYAKKVKIGRNVWIGSGVNILPGVTIGDNAVVGMGSVVTKDIPANAVAVGNPAKVIKYIEAKESDII